MTYTLIMAVSGMIPIWLLSLLTGRLFFKDMETSKKINYSTSTAYVLGVILSGFGNMNGGNFSPFYVEYFLSAIFLILIRQGILKARGK